MLKMISENEQSVKHGVLNCELDSLETLEITARILQQESNWRIL